MSLPTERVKINTGFHVWEALKRGDLTFFVLKNDKFYQPGDIVKFIKMNKDGTGYEPTGLPRVFSHDLYYKLGFMLQGGVVNSGIEPGYAAFSLIRVTE